MLQSDAIHLKNAGVTYQRLINMMFKDVIGKSMEFYVDDMLVKSKMAGGYAEHPKEDVQHLIEVPNDDQPPKVCLWSQVGQVHGLYSKPTWDRS